MITGAAGMTTGAAGMTTGAAGMTTGAAGMTTGAAGMTTGAAGMTTGAAGMIGGGAGNTGAAGTNGAAGSGAAGAKDGGAAGTGASDGGAGQGGGGADAGAVTFTMIYNLILGPTPQVAASSCGGAVCHHSPGGGMGITHIDMKTKATAYTGVKKYVVAGNVNGSKFFTEVNTGAMPEGKPKLPQNLITMISDWIKAGALDN
jgi:hypothetical protein